MYEINIQEICKPPLLLSCKHLVKYWGIALNLNDANNNFHLSLSLTLFWNNHKFSNVHWLNSTLDHHFFWFTYLHAGLEYGYWEAGIWLRAEPESELRI